MRHIRPYQHALWALATLALAASLFSPGALVVALPLLLIALCPLLMIFMMRGMHRSPPHDAAAKDELSQLRERQRLLEAELGELRGTHDGGRSGARRS
jgi:choline-glycine betaine transporter